MQVNMPVTICWPKEYGIVLEELPSGEDAICRASWTFDNGPIAISQIAANLQLNGVEI